MAYGIRVGVEIDENGKPAFFIENSIKTVREKKGHSLLAFPAEYVVIDLETTGLSPEWDEIIEMSAIRYSNGVKTAEYTTLVKPENEIDEYITELTGITNEMLATAPRIEDCIADYLTFIGDSIILGYNVNFDIDFLYDNAMYVLERPLSNDFVDVMRFSKRALPELKHHRQVDTAEYFGISVETAHRGMADCETCNACYEALQAQILKDYNTLDEFLQKTKWEYVHAKDIKAETDVFDEDHPLYGKVCVFTGALEKMKRADAMQLVANLGGIPADSITKKTNFLILGNNDYCATIKDGKSSKQKKAEALILAGADLQIIPEQVFYDMLGE